MQQRILLLITDLRIGGTPTVVRELAVRLAREQGAYVHVACLDRWGPVADQLQAGGIAVTALAARGRFDMSAIYRLVRLIRREKINTVFSFLIHANAAAAMAILRCRQIRFIQSIQNTQPRPRWHWKLQHIIQEAAEKIVVPSPSVSEAAQKWSGVPAEKIIIIPNAIEIGEFSHHNSTVSGNRVGFIGRLDPIKRIDDLIAAISLLPENVTLEIFGEGSQRREIETTVQRLNLTRRVTLHGIIQGPAKALANLDVLVLPSDAEGFGLVLIEAMAAGVSVVGTNVPGIRDVIRDGINGILIPPRNPQALAEAIKRVLSDVELRKTLTAGGLSSVREKYAWPIVYKQYQTLLLNHT